MILFLYYIPIIYSFTLNKVLRYIKFRYKSGNFMLILIVPKYMTVMCCDARKMLQISSHQCCVESFFLESSDLTLCCLVSVKQRDKQTLDMNYIGPFHMFECTFALRRLPGCKNEASFSYIVYAPLYMFSGHLVKI